MTRLNDTDDFGNRMKAYEAVETARKLDAHLPIYARIDGRAFSTFTRGMRRPFDLSMTGAMIETAKYLLHATHARIGYTQSDEISLVWLAERPGIGCVLFRQGAEDGKCPRLDGDREVYDGAPGRIPRPATALRCAGVPASLEGGSGEHRPRAMDARKNAISMVAQSRFSAKTLHGKDQAAMLAMLADVGVDFEADYPTCLRRGTFIRRKPTSHLLTDEELARIPEGRRPTGPVMRAHYAVLDMPPFNKVANRVGVIFAAEDPVLTDFIHMTTLDIRSATIGGPADSQ